jgi:hypothetical protein
VKLWHDQFDRVPPFPINDRNLFVAYSASAEWGVFLQLGWPLPSRIIDLYAEFRNETNGLPLAAGSGLRGALIYHDLVAITKEEKKGFRDLALRGGPWTSSERQELLDYCQSDVDCLGPLLERMAPAITAVPHGFSQALIRGRYTAAAARMEHQGIPIDDETRHRLADCWDAIKLDVIEAIDADFGVYEKASFREGLFVRYLAGCHIAWPRHDTGRLKLDQDTFRDMAKLHPHLNPLKELRHTVSDLRVIDLAAGPDHRNRVSFHAFGQKAGRNNPKSGPSVLGKSVWLRSLIKPPIGRAVASCDWSAQEVHIAAVLSGDQAMLDVLATEDPYLRFAVMAGMAEPGATKATHKLVRDLCKTAVLGNNYGQSPYGLARKAGLSMIEAEHLHRKLAQAFPTFTGWIDREIDVGYLSGYMTSRLGWRLHTRLQGERTLRNFPMQSNGAEMLRLACCLATEWGVEVCAPLHDALWVEADMSEIEDTVAATRRAMEEASKLVLDGYVVPSEATVIRYPDRHLDERGRVMWDRVMGVLDRLATA